MKRTINALLLLTLLGCSVISDHDLELEQELNSLLLEEVGELELSVHTDFDWDELIVLGPYSIHERISKDQHVEFTGSLNSPIDQLDSYNLLVFLKDKKEVKYVELDRHADFAPEQICIPREETHFILQDGTLKSLTNWKNE